MTSAGRILIMPKGGYDSSTTYEMLDLVTHNGASWLAKKTVVGVEPSASNSEYWHNMLDFDPSDFETRKTDGGTLRFTENPAGNAWISHTMYLPHANTTRFFANVVGVDSLYVTGISITDYQPDRVTATFFLNQPVNYDVTIAVGYMY